MKPDLKIVQPSVVESDEMRERVEQAKEKVWPLYRDLDPKEFRPALAKFGSDESVYLHGDVGVGKTYQAWLWWVRWACSKDYQWAKPQFYQSAELMDCIRRSYNGEKFKVADHLLVIDDLGTERPTEWVQEQLGLIINHRYVNLLPTFITSNLSLDELADRIGDRSASRIQEMCQVLKLGGVDRRTGGVG